MSIWKFSHGWLLSGRQTHRHRDRYTFLCSLLHQRPLLSKLWEIEACKHLGFHLVSKVKQVFLQYLPNYEKETYFSFQPYKKCTWGFQGFDFSGFPLISGLLLSNWFSKEVSPVLKLWTLLKYVFSYGLAISACRLQSLGPWALFYIWHSYVLW